MKRRLRRVVQEIIRRFGARQLALQSVSFGLLLLGSSAAIAAGGGAPDLPPPEFLWIGEDESGGHALPLAPWIVDFIVFVLLLVAVTKGPFKKLFQSRHDSIKVAVEEAAAAHRTAEANHKLYSEKLEGVETEAKGLVDEANQLGADEKSRIIEGAKAYGQRLETDATRLVEQEFVKATHSLKAEAANQAVDKAKDLISSKLTPADHQRFFELALEEIRSGNVAESGGQA